MAGLIDYAGAIIMEIDGREYEIIELSEEIKGDKKLVKTMNRRRRPSGMARIIPEYGLKATLAIPLSGEPNWMDIKGAKITIFPAEDSGDRVTYQDCFVTDMSGKYNTDDEARRDLSISALDRIVE